MFESQSFVLLIKIVHIVHHSVKIVSIQNELKLRSFSQSTVANTWMVCNAFTNFVHLFFNFLYSSMTKRP